MMGRDAPSGDRLEDRIPDVRTKEGGRHMGVLEVQDWSGERLELGAGFGREVNELHEMGPVSQMVHKASGNQSSLVDLSEMRYHWHS